MPYPFSALSRADRIERLSSMQYDLVIIGGGITGAGIALDAASRGLKTALIEKNDFAFGTSSRSTKLIHGGLRYLKQLEFGLVKEVGSERAVVHALAPHLVVPEKMLLPLYEKKGLGYWLTSLGLMVYDFLAGVKVDERRRMLTRAQTLRYEPLLRHTDVKGGAIYAEYRTDDARLTIEIIKMAGTHQADAVNYVRAVRFVYDDNHVSGVVAKDEMTGRTFTLSGRVVVNATGPWVDELRQVDGSLSARRLHLTKGVHVVVAWEKFPVSQAIYFDVDDGRMIFAIPRGRVTYVGTTDTNYDGDKDRPMTTAVDAAYLVKAVNATFSGVALSVTDIESSWAGLRPLIHEEGKSSSELSRKDEIFESPSGLISIAGGKLTGYRKMAERVVDLVIRRFYPDLRDQECYTDKIPLTGFHFQSVKQVRNYTQSIAQKLMPYAVSGHTARYLVETYGKQSDIILDYFFRNLNEYEAELSLLRAEAWFAVQYEMVTGLQDFFARRTGLLYFEIRKVIQHRKSIGLYLQELLQWDDFTLNEELSRLDATIAEITEFKNDQLVSKPVTGQD